MISENKLASIGITLSQPGLRNNEIARIDVGTLAELSDSIRELQSEIESYKSETCEFDCSDKVLIRTEIQRVQAEVERLRKVLEEMNAYLDTGTNNTAIYQSSGFHKQIKEALSKAECEKAKEE